MDIPTAYKINNMTRSLTALLVFLFMLFSQDVSAQSATLSLQPDSIVPGQQSKLLLEVNVPADMQVVFPVINNPLTEDIEIITFGRPDTVVTAGNMKISSSYAITAWKDGLYPIIPFTFYSAENGDTLFFESNAVLLQVVPLAIDLAEGLKDIRPILRIPVSFTELLPYILAALLLGVTGWLVYRYLKNRKEKPRKDDIWQKTDIPAHVAALTSLQKLNNQKLWQNGKIKQYHTELTYILRMYLEKRFSINAPEMTSSEIILAMEPQIPDEDMRSILSGILEQADLVKFAKHIPEDSENESAIEMAIEFVRYHIPQAHQADEAAQKAQVRE